MKWFPHLQRFGFTFYFLEVVSSGADEDLEEELPMIFGIGLARRIALMNHSCRPNCEIDYDGNGTAIVTALRQIRPKEELTISYIDETKPLGVRRRVLARRYGFKCFCRRNQEVKAKNFRLAIEHYSKAIDMLTGESFESRLLAELLGNRCLCHMRLGRYDLALPDAKEAELSDLAGAWENAMRAAKLQPENLEVQALQDTIHRMEGGAEA
eukprot:symbB.v1.2.025803.t2/scaffold2528.1/size92917/4